MPLFRGGIASTLAVLALLGCGGKSLTVVNDSTFCARSSPLLRLASDLGARKVVHVGVTRNPTTTWVAQQPHVVQSSVQNVLAERTLNPASAWTRYVFGSFAEIPCENPVPVGSSSQDSV